MHSTLDHGIDGAGGAQRPRHRGVYFTKRNFVEVALAAQANMSPALFRKRFTATAGMSVHSYVLKERIERACELIDECNLPLATIAAQCGFSSQSHMTKIFRRELGATPAELRRRSDGGDVAAKQEFPHSLAPPSHGGKARTPWSH